MKRSRLDSLYLTLDKGTHGMISPSYIYTKWIYGNQPYIIVPHLNILYQHAPEKEAIFKYFMRYHFPINKMKFHYTEFIENYRTRQSNLTVYTWSRKNHKQFSRYWKDQIISLLSVWGHFHLPMDTIDHVLEYIAPLPISNNAWRFIHNIPRLVSTARTTIPLLHKIQEKDDPTILTRTFAIITRWKTNRRRYIHTWSPGWHNLCKMYIGDNWTNQPLHVLLVVIQHYVTRGAYGRYEMNAVVEAMLLEWGQTKTLEKLYYLWDLCMPMFPNIGEGPLIHMITKVSLATNQTQLYKVCRLFDSEMSEAICRFGLLR